MAQAPIGRQYAVGGRQGATTQPVCLLPTAYCLLRTDGYGRRRTLGRTELGPVSADSPGTAGPDFTFTGIAFV